MGAHNLATLDTAIRRATSLRDGLKASLTPASQAWAGVLTHALEQPHGGTLKEWFSRHDGRAVDTLQATLQSDADGFRNLWAPGHRVVDAHTRKTYVTLDGSRRDYADVTTLTAGHYYVGFAKWGQGVQILIYSPA